MTGEVVIDLTPVQHLVGAFVKREAIKNCPVDKGLMRAKVDYRIEGAKVILFCSDPNAADMEWGTPPSILSPVEAAELEAWSKRHKANPAHIISYIQKHGIKVGTAEQPLHITSYGRDSYRPFLRPAVFMNMQQIAEIIAQGVKEAAQQPKLMEYLKEAMR
jgi:hypothetical protein